MGTLAAAACCPKHTQQDTLLWDLEVGGRVQSELPAALPCQSVPTASTGPLLTGLTISRTGEEEQALRRNWHQGKQGGAVDPATQGQPPTAQNTQARL